MTAIYLDHVAFFHHRQAVEKLCCVGGHSFSTACQVENFIPRVNIVILNDAAYIRGGGDRVAFDSATALASAGHRVILFTAFGPVAPELSAHAGLTVICLGSVWLRQEQNSWRAAIHGLWNWKAAGRLRTVLADLDPRETIVHAHLYSSALTASVLAESSRDAPHDAVSAKPTIAAQTTPATRPDLLAVC